jgi:hypothetical protein
MKSAHNMDQMIEALVVANCGANAGLRDKYLYRESLRSLARLAVAEHALNLKKDLDKTVIMVRACETA